MKILERIKERIEVEDRGKNASPPEGAPKCPGCGKPLSKVLHKSFKCNSCGANITPKKDEKSGSITLTVENGGDTGKASKQEDKAEGGENGEGAVEKGLILGGNKIPPLINGEPKMKQTLQELKKIMNDIVGSFVIDGNGDILAHDLPDTLVERAERMAKLMYYVTTVMKARKPLERIILDSENLKIIAALITINERILVVIGEKDINLPLLKLVSNVTVNRLKGDKKEASVKEDATQKTDLCNFYDTLYSIPAKKLYDIFGEEAGMMFDEKAEEARIEHPRLFSNLSFSNNGRPKMSKIKMSARGVSIEKLKAGLEDLLVSMLETLKYTAGSTIADKAIDEVVVLKEEPEK